MKKEQDLKEVIKEAILEALTEFVNGRIDTAAKEPEGPIEPESNGGYTGFGLR